MKSCFNLFAQNNGKNLKKVKKEKEFTRTGPIF